MYRYTLLILLLAAMIAGCSGGGNPVVPQEDTTALDGVPVIDLSFAGDMFNAIGLMGAYELTIDPNDMTAEIVAKRTSAVGEGYIVSGINFFTMAPCANCLKLSGAYYMSGEAIVVSFNIKHPFEPGDIKKEPTATNRRDLDVFDLAMVIEPKQEIPQTYTLTGTSAYTNACVNPDGFTRELSNVLRNPAALPYFHVVDNSKTEISTWNKFAMGASVEFSVMLALASQLKFDIYLTMGYGVSAIKRQRLTPKYYNPEFNRKAAWKVEVIPPTPVEMGSTWDNVRGSTEFDVVVRVWDWQQGATVYGNPADFLNAPNNYIYASSNVASVSVEIPGMTNTLSSVTTATSGTGMHDDPLIFRVPIANQNLIAPGQYKGLVKVTDQRTPGVIGDRDFLIDTSDGIVLNNFTIAEYATYQIFVANVVQGPTSNLVWAKRAGGANNEHGCAITALSDNSIVVTGNFWDIAIFGEGEPNETILTNTGSDIFIARYNPNGTLAWAKRAGGTGDTYVRGITTLSDNFTVITGYFIGTSTFGEGETYQTILTSAGEYDIFLARYNPNGTLVWAKRAGGTRSEAGHGITTLSDNSTVVTGRFEGAVTFGEGEPNQTTLYSANAYTDDIFIARYNTNGTLSWAKRAGGISGDKGQGITALSDNSVVLTGEFQDTATFGQDESNQTVLTSAGSDDIFVARYNPDGTLAWAKRAGGISRDFSYSITTLSDNSTVITGCFESVATFELGEPNETILTSAGDRDIFITKYNPNGTLAWAKRAGGAESEVGFAITTSSDDSTVITGYFYGVATFGQGETNQTILTSAGDRDIFIAKYNPNGTVVGARRAGGTGWNEGKAITTLPDNSTALTGNFQGTATFGPGEPNETILTSVAGNADIFIARFEP